MKITDQNLLNDILDIIVRGQTFTNTATGETIQAVFLGDIHEQLYGYKGRQSMLTSKRIWKNASTIDAPDLRESGFTIIRAPGNPNGGSGNWKSPRGRSLSKSQTLITL